MSQLNERINQIANKLNNKYRTRSKPSESTSSKVQSWTVRDSRPSRNHMTNKYVSSVYMPSIHMLLVLSLGLFCVPTLPALITSSNASATTTNSITITLDKSTVNLDMTNKNATGTFAKSGDSTISVTTTNATGYTLKIQGSEDPNQSDDEYYKKLINSNDNNPSTNSLTSISSATAEDQFKSLAGTAYNGMWGYLPSKYCTGTTGTSSTNCNTNTSFLSAPDTTGDTLDITSTANTTANKYTLAIGARVDSSAKLGSYSNTYVILATTNAIPYSITYDDSVVANMPTDIKDGTFDDNVTISSTKPTRSGYKFLGWCTVMPTSSNGTDLDNCSGTQYAAEADWAIDKASTSNALQLYAMWKVPPYIQDYTLATCKTEADSSDDMVLDRRDGSDYTVRYINGACWMTQNLRITGTISAEYSNFDGDDFDTMAGGDMRGNKSSYVAAMSHAADDEDVTATSGLGYTKEQLGAWYNYCAASAGEICQDASTQEATQDICPSGWHLPTGGKTADTSLQQSLADAIGYYLAIFSPVMGGHRDAGILAYTDVHGMWWSSTASSDVSRYYLRYSLNESNISTDSRRIGLYVRCVRTE